MLDLYCIKLVIMNHVNNFLLIFNFHHIYIKPFKLKTMIHSITRQCTRAFYQPSMKQFMSLQSAKFLFSTQTPQQAPRKSRNKRPQQQKSDFSPIDYYRNTIRRVNIRSNGRGTFTPYNLQKLINMSTTEEHAKVMYEAYYNYMGHFTLIPNKVVDTLVIRSIMIGNQVDKVLEIFSHHNYLTYFPHYDATMKFIKHLVAIKDQQNLEHMFRILIRSPLIKINAKMVNELLEIASDPEASVMTKEYVTKVLLFRRKLVDGMNYEDLLSKVATALEQGEFGPFEAKPMIRTAVQELLAEPTVSQEDTSSRLILSSTFGMIDNCASIIAQQQQQINSQYDRFFDYLVKLAPRASEQVNYGTVLKEALAEAKLSIDVTEKLQKLANGNNQAEE